MSNGERRYCSSCGARLNADQPGRCQSCGSEHYRNAVPSAGALVVRDRSILLVQRENPPFAGAWDIPGGFCEENEHPRDTARREVEEELGVVAAIHDLVGIWLDEYRPPDGQPTRITLNIYYLATMAESQLPHPASAEVRNVAWFASANLPREVAFPESTLPAIEAALGKIGS